MIVTKILFNYNKVKLVNQIENNIKKKKSNQFEDSLPNITKLLVTTSFFTGYLKKEINSILKKKETKTL